jgi:hypothetical protein
MKGMEKVIVSMLTAGLLVACGGGGGGDSDSPATLNGVTITTDNAELVSAEVLNSVDVVEGISSGSTLITGVSVTANGDGFNYRDFVLEQLNMLSVVRQQQLSSGVVGVVIPAASEPCSGGGSVTVSGNVADPMLDTLSAGDTLLLLFNNCNEEGILLSGQLRLTINAVSTSFDGNPPFDIDISVVMTGLSVTDGGSTLSSDGDMRLALNEDISGNYGATFSGKSVTVSEGSQMETLSSYHYALTANDSSGDYSIEIEGTLESTVLDGAVSFMTVQAFTGNDFTGTGDPTQGILLMTSDFDGSQARLTAEADGSNVTIEVDADGDDDFEDSVMTTWATLYSQ